MPNYTGTVVFDTQTNLYLFLLLKCRQEVERITVCKNNDDNCSFLNASAPPSCLISAIRSKKVLKTAVRFEFDSLESVTLSQITNTHTQMHKGRESGGVGLNFTYRQIVL